MTEYELEVASAEDVAPAWAGTAASFALQTHDDRQFVAFYDADRRATVGRRTLPDGEWTFGRLAGERIGWDAHNDLALAVDADGHVHVAGNVHNDPLTYFRTRAPGDVTSFERVHEMVGEREGSVTYPRFFRGPTDELVFEYRDGGSGGGDWLYNVYDPASQSWERLLDEPLTEGGDRMNAYPHGPVAGPDGYYHYCWVWRDTPDAATNHDLSYARSPDLRRWETSRGEPLDLPITIETGEVIDPVPAGGGLINGNTKLGFDPDGRVVCSYHKYDSAGNTQVYVARPGDEGWDVVQVSDWDYRWEFGGYGSIPFEVRVGAIRLDADGRPVLPYEHAREGQGLWVLDEATLEPVTERSPWTRYPPELYEPEGEHPELSVQWEADGGEGRDVRSYALRWDALAPNRDREREESPPPTTLRVYGFE